MSVGYFVQHFATSGGSVVYTPKGAYSLKPGANPNQTPKLGRGPTQFSWGRTGYEAWTTYPERFAVYDDGNVRSADNSMYRYLVSQDQLADPNNKNIDAVMS